MQPQQPLPPTIPPTQPAPSQYDFIINPAQPSKKSPLGGGSSLVVRILIVLGGLFVLAIVAAVVISLLGHGSGDNKEAYIAVAQDQSELAHLAATGNDTAVSTDAKNLSVNIKLTMTSQQSALTAYLQSRRIKIDDKTRALKQSTSVDKQLTDAQSASNFDTVFTEVMHTQLTTYQRDLSSAYAHSRPAGQALLKQQYQGAQLLLNQLTQSTN